MLGCVGVCGNIYASAHEEWTHDSLCKALRERGRAGDIGMVYDMERNISANQIAQLLELNPKAQKQSQRAPAPSVSAPFQQHVKSPEQMNGHKKPAAQPRQGFRGQKSGIAPQEDPVLKAYSESKGLQYFPSNNAVLKRMMDSEFFFLEVNQSSSSSSSSYHSSSHK